MEKVDSIPSLARLVHSKSHAQNHKPRPGSDAGTDAGSDAGCESGKEVPAQLSAHPVKVTTTTTKSLALARPRAWLKSLPSAMSISISIKIPSSSSSSSHPSSSSSTPAHSQYSASMAAGFFDWRRPAPRDLPRLSSSDSSSSDSDSEPASPPESPTELTWTAAAAETAQGVHYVLARFPACGRAPRAPPFAREPLLVHAGERVEVLDEPDDHAVRVRVLASGAVGLVPAHNVETPLERLARRNMLFNEAATCPVECRYRHSKSGELAHAHSRCMPFAFRRTLAAALHARDGTPADEDEDEDAFDPFELDAPTPVVRARKTVGFARADRPVVFRYPSLEAVDGDGGDGAESCADDADAREREDGWWDGWEEERPEEPELEVHVDGGGEYEYAC